MRIIILNAYAFFLLFLIPVSLFSQEPSLVEIKGNTSLVLTCGLVVSSVPCGTTPDFGIPVVKDEFDPLVGITYTDITRPGICPQEYSVTRIWTATNNCGNTDVCSRTIFVEDSVAPVMSIPVGVSPVEYGIALEFENATADDECDGNELITYALPGVKKW